MASQITTGGYQQMAQTFLNLAADNYAQDFENDGAVTHARLLYEAHGPFKLNFHIWCPEQREAEEEWYKGP